MEWRDVPGWEGLYKVSSEGIVESVERMICSPGETRCRLMPGRIMRQHLHWRGYRVVWLRRPGVHKKYFVHRLVALAFIPNPDQLPIVNHLDGDRQHNKLPNLEWVDESGNAQHGIARRKAAVQSENTSDMEF